MIPYLLAALGGYFIGESQKKETDAPKMASGGQLPRYFRVSFMGDNYATTAWGHTESEAINNARKSLKLGDDVEVKDIVEIKFRNGVPVSEWAKELRDKGRQFEDGGMMAKGGKLDNEDELFWHGLKLTTKGSKAFVSGKPNPDYFGDENKFTDGGGYGGWWKSPNNFSIKKFEDLVKSKIPTDGVKFDSESSMFYAEGTRERMRKFFIDLMDSATMQYPLEFPFQTSKEYFNWESKRHRKAKNDIKEGRDKQAIDDFYFQMFSNYGEKSVKNELKKLFRKIDMAEPEGVSKEKAIRMVADVFKNVNEFNTEVYDTEPENNIIFFAEEKLKSKGYLRKYYENLKKDVQEANY